MIFLVPKSVRKTLESDIEEDIEGSSAMSHKKERKKKFLNEVDLSKLTPHKHSFTTSKHELGRMTQLTPNYGIIMVIFS